MSKPRAKFDTATPYTAGFTIMRQGNKVVFVLRENAGWMNGYYGVPAGKVEKNETFTECAAREAKEEVGVDVKLEDLTCVHICHRMGDDSEWVDAYFEASSWKGEPYNAEPAVHSKFEWLDLDDLPENIIPSQRHALEQIKAGKAYSEYGWEDN